MDWELVSTDFNNCDGALCDIYVQNASLDDWQAVIGKLIQEHPRLKFRIGEKTSTHLMMFQDCCSDSQTTNAQVCMFHWEALL